MKNELIEQKQIVLDERKMKLISSGWGKEVTELAEVHNLTYSSDGLKVKGFVAFPKGISTKIPCIMWNRGGLGELGVLDDFNAFGILGLLASWGYFVFASQYRGNAGGDGKDTFGGEDVNDIFNLMEIANNFEFADTNNWGIEGWSRGGMMTYLSLMRTEVFKAAVTIGGVSNLRCDEPKSKFMEKLIERTYGKLSPEEELKMCKSRSIIANSELISQNTPLMIIHGLADDRVPVEDSILLSQKLAKFKTNLKVVLLEEGTHFLKAHKSEVNSLRKEWFNRYLK